ncbi:Proteasome activator complex subunit 3 [Coelomomyces lativittatus]|nr:Proteasome activator complex subunit 3 [Coelomomyces lativittatus]
MTMPKIEEGNQFEVAVREDMVKELSRAEDDAFSILDSTSQFHISRGKIVSKILKYPTIEDYHLATLQIDMKQYHQLRLTLRDLANNYIVLNDLLTKNLEQLKFPKEHATVDIIS